MEEHDTLKDEKTSVDGCEHRGRGVKERDRDWVWKGGKGQRKQNA